MDEEPKVRGGINLYGKSEYKNVVEGQWGKVNTEYRWLSEEILKLISFFIS